MHQSAHNSFYKPSWLQVVPFYFVSGSTSVEFARTQEAAAQSAAIASIKVDVTFGS